MWSKEFLIDKLKNKLAISVIGILISALFVVGIVAGAETQTPKTLDYTEGGHLETDFGVFFMSEWWYLNGNTKIVSKNGEVKELGFFVVYGHAESPMFIDDNGTQLSLLSTFHGLYFEDGSTDFRYDDTYVPQSLVGNFIALHTPYVRFNYPTNDNMLFGSANTAYYMKYAAENIELHLIFHTNTEKTVDTSAYPLNYTAYERAYGKLHGFVILNGEKYHIVKGEGYMDHMIPVSRGVGMWTMEMHGWNWLEVTTKDYQAVLYATRALEDGYAGYTDKHLTILNRNTGKILAEYSGDEVTIEESEWVVEADFLRLRPTVITVSTSDGTNLSVNTGTMLYFDTPYPEPSGFVDFMSHNASGATIMYNGGIQHGNSFNEYLVTDLAVLLSLAP